MPYKILTLLIFTILFPALIAGSTVLLLKSGLVDTGVHTPKSDIKSTEIKKTTQENFSDQKRVSDVLEYPKYYFKGKIDGKLQVWLILNGYLNPFQDSTLESGQILIEGENAIEDIYGTFPNPKTCKNDCSFSLEIPYYGGGDTLKLAKNASNPIFNGVWQQKDKQTPLDEIRSLTGVYTPLDSKQKLKFELNRSEEFKIEDYKVLSFQNPDKTLEIIGNNCGIIGFEQISESSDLSGNCYLVAISSGKIKNATKVLLRGCDKKSTNSDCGKRYFTFGKKEGEIQYLFDNGFTQDACTKGGDFYVLKYDMTSGKISKVGFFEYNICTSPINEKSNAEYLNAKEIYSLPKP